MTPEGSTTPANEASGQSTWRGTGWTVPGWELPPAWSDLGAWLGGSGSDERPATVDDLGHPSVAEGLEQLAADGVSALRVPLDWARLEPANGRRDGDAVEHLRAALSIARDHGFTIWACLHAGALPGWFAHDERGFADERSRRYFWARHVEGLGEATGDLVDGWIPVVEPARWAKSGWLDGTGPPGRVDDGGAFARNLEGVHIASVEAALRLREAGKPVSSAQWAVPVFAARDDPRLPPPPEAEVAADEVDEVLWRSWQRMIDEEVLVVPGRSPVNVAGARQAFDVIGITYRHAAAVAADRTWRAYPQALATDEHDQVPWSEGLAIALHRSADAWPDRDLAVVDVAVSLTQPEARRSYLSEVADVVAEAAGGGMRLKGAFAPV